MISSGSRSNADGPWASFESLVSRSISVSGTTIGFFSIEDRLPSPVSQSVSVVAILNGKQGPNRAGYGHDSPLLLISRRYYHDRRFHL